VRIGAVLIVIAGLTVVVLKAPKRTPKAQGPSNVPVHVEKSPKPIRLTSHDEAAALRVAAQFISSAVARKNVDRSWKLVAPELRAGFTRRQWATQDIPVVPFPVRSARWQFDYADSEGVGFSVALFPTQESHQRAQVFLVGLHTIGKAKRQHWVIDNWQAAPSQGLQPVSGGPGGGAGGVLEQTSPEVNRFAKSTESAAWLLLPLGLLSLIIIIPLWIASVNWYRGYRAERAFHRIG
jgi:hypothetical protein